MIFIDLLISQYCMLFVPIFLTHVRILQTILKLPSFKMSQRTVLPWADSSVSTIKGSVYRFKSRESEYDINYVSEETHTCMCCTSAQREDAHIPFRLLAIYELNINSTYLLEIL